MNSNCIRLKFVAAILIAVFSDVTNADLFFDDEAEFLMAAEGSLEFQSFELLQSTYPLSDQNQINTPSFAITTPTARLGVWDTSFSGIHPTDGQQFVHWGATANDPITFTFGSRLNTFGITLTDAADFPVSLSLTADNGLSIPNFLVGVLPNANERFVGVISDSSFTSITISIDGGDGIGLDAAYTGANIPEPNSLAALLAALLTITETRRRR